MSVLRRAGSFAIGCATPDDLPALSALAQRVFRATYGEVIPETTLSRYLSWHFGPAAFADHMAAGDRLLVARDTGMLAGYARLTSSPPPACVSDAGATELAQLYVDQPFQNLGVGAALLVAACTQAVTPIWLAAWERNQRALRFYQRYGFAQVGWTDIHVGPVVFHDHVLVRG